MVAAVPYFDADISDLTGLLALTALTASADELIPIQTDATAKDIFLAESHEQRALIGTPNRTKAG